MKKAFKHSSTFYRHRRNYLNASVNISAPEEENVEMENILPADPDHTGDKASECSDGSAYEDEEDLREPVPALSEELRDWANDNSITHSAMNDLLFILRQQPNLHYLPKDSRTLRLTPKEVNVVKLGSGQFWSGSIEGILLPMLEGNPHVEKISLQISL